MAIIATGSKTIIDLSDGKSLSCYLGANQPRTQIHDVNNSAYSPDWTTTAGKLVITPVVYANQTAIALNNTALTITYKRKEGSGSEAVLAAGETAPAAVYLNTCSPLIHALFASSPVVSRANVMSAVALMVRPVSGSA